MATDNPAGSPLQQAQQRTETRVAQVIADEQTMSLMNTSAQQLASKPEELPRVAKLRRMLPETSKDQMIGNDWTQIVLTALERGTVQIAYMAIEHIAALEINEPNPNRADAVAAIIMLAEMLTSKDQPAEHNHTAYFTNTLDRGGILPLLPPEVAQHLAEAAMLEAKHDLDRAVTGTIFGDGTWSIDPMGFATKCTIEYATTKTARDALRIAKRWAPQAAKQHEKRFRQFLEQYEERWMAESHFRHTFGVVPYQVANHHAHRRTLTDQETSRLWDVMNQHASALTLLEAPYTKTVPFRVLNARGDEKTIDVIAKATLGAEWRWIYRDDPHERIAASTGVTFAVEVIHTARRIKQPGYRSAAILAGTGIALQCLTSTARKRADNDMRDAVMDAAHAVLDAIPQHVEAEPGGLDNIRNGLLGIK